MDTGPSESTHFPQHDLIKSDTQKKFSRWGKVAHLQWVTVLQEVLELPVCRLNYLQHSLWKVIAKKKKKKFFRSFPYFLHLYPVYSHTPGPQAALLFLTAFSSDTGLMEAWTVQIKSDLFQSELGPFDIWLSIRYTFIFDYYSKAKVCLEQWCKLQFLDFTISSNINV